MLQMMSDFGGHPGRELEIFWNGPPNGSGDNSGGASRAKSISDGLSMQM